MTQEQKIIRAKLGLLELAKQLGNVSRACKMMGYSCLWRDLSDFSSDPGFQGQRQHLVHTLLLLDSHLYDAGLWRCEAGHSGGRDNCQQRGNSRLHDTRFAPFSPRAKHRAPQLNCD